MAANVGVSFPRRIRHKKPLTEPKLAAFSTLLHLIAMQTVVGSNPISRFAKGLHLQVFPVRAVG
jgi:hypothetical protein